MMRSLVLLCVSASLVGGCTGGYLKPIPQPGMVNGRETCSPGAGGVATPMERSRLGVEYYRCELRNRSLDALAQSDKWENRKEWRDVPLLGAAVTIAGILFLGKKDANGGLIKSQQDIVSATGFGAAAFSTFANYLSPETARRLLLESASGHGCMAEQSNTLLNVWDDVTRRIAARDQLEIQLGALEALLKDAGGDTPQLAEIRTIRDAGYSALDLYQKQIDALLNARTRISDNTFDFGRALMTQAERGTVNTADMVKAITEQTTNNVHFEQAKDAVDQPVATALVEMTSTRINTMGLVPARAQSTGDLLQQASTVALWTRRLTRGLPNAEALVLGFKTCVTTALAGGDAHSSDLQRFSGN